MPNKTTAINLMVEPETKKKLKDKATEMGLTLTAFFEKIAKEDLCFIDENFKKTAKFFMKNFN